MFWQSESGDAHLWLDTFWWGTERHGQCHRSGLISAALLCHYHGQLQKSCTVYPSHPHFMRLVTDCLPLSTSEWRSCVSRLYDCECNSGWWWRHQFQRICLVDDKVESQFLPNVIHKESTSRWRVKLLFPLNWPFQEWFEEWFGTWLVSSLLFLFFTRFDFPGSSKTQTSRKKSVKHSGFLTKREMDLSQQRI